MTRKFLGSGVGNWAAYLAGAGHGYLMFTDEGDQGTSDPVKRAITTFSWHPSTWNYADGPGGSDAMRGAKSPGRIWEQHEQDMKPSGYKTYLVAKSPAEQAYLLRNIRKWIASEQVGYELGEAKRDAENSQNEVGTDRHEEGRRDGAYYSLNEQNCVWWAAIMLKQSGFDVTPKTGVGKALMRFNRSIGAADDVVTGRRSPFRVNKLRDTPSFAPGDMNFSFGIHSF